MTSVNVREEIRAILDEVEVCPIYRQPILSAYLHLSDGELAKEVKMLREVKAESKEMAVVAVMFHYLNFRPGRD